MRALLLALALFTVSCAASSRGSSVAPQDRCVILISVDGLASYYLDDPKAHMPTLRRMAREGAAAKGLVVSFPSVTWPNHTTLVTGVEPGKHGVIGNDYLDRKTGKVVKFIPDPVFDKHEIVKTPTIYDVAHQAGFKTAGVIWPATRNAKTLDLQMPDVFPDELFQKYSTRSLLDELRNEGIWVDMQQTWCRSQRGGVPRDWMYASTVVHLLKKHKPNVILLHLVEADHAQHGSGPRTPEAYWSMSHIDDRLRQILDGIEKSGMRDRTTVFVTSDHGFIGYSKSIRPNVLLKQKGLIKADGKKLVSRRAFVHQQGGGAFVYVMNPADRAELVPQLKEMLAGIEGVKWVRGIEDYAKMGLATPTQDPRMPDLVMSTRDGYSFSGSFEGDAVVTKMASARGAHGYDPTDPLMYGSLVAWGAGIRPGSRLPVVRSVDVAPTMARLLGLEMKNVDGRVLKEILSDSR